MNVIADSSVLIHLARIECFYLLRNLYGELVIATGVYFEVVQRGWGFAGSLETERAIADEWLKVRSIQDRANVMDLIRRFGISLGNAETIQLALESKADLALADEAEVRDLLEEYSMDVRGCIGIVIEAARRGLVNMEEARRALKRLVETGYRVSDQVLNEAYQLLGER